MMYKALLFVFLLFISKIAFSQTVQEREIEIIIEAAAENLPDDYDYSELINQLTDYRQHPLNLNKATTEQLQNLLFLSALQITALQEHIRANGKMIDLLELQSIDLFDLQTIQKLLPFVTITPDLNFNAVNLKNIFRYGKNDFIFRYGQVLQDQKGFTIPKNSKLSHYTGNAQKLLGRYRFDFQNRIQFAFNMEKDAGEPFFAGKNSMGFDFYTASLSFKNFGVINRLVIGDYTLQFGQGLSLYNGFGFGKNADATLIPKVSRGLNAYSSTNEINYFRGVAATLKFNSIEITPFISDQPIDATVQKTANPVYISSLGTTGYHRTPTELTNKNAANQLTYGFNLNYSKRNFKIGTTAYSTQFEYPIQRKLNTYNQFYFAGKELNNLSFYYDYSYHNLYFFGETGKSLGSGAATVNGLLASLSSKISIVLLYRDYSKKYNSFYNEAISEATEAQNEKGFYSGLNLKFSPRWNFSGYADFFHFTWLKYQVSQPNSSGHEFLGRLTYSPTNRLTAYLNYRFKKKQQNNDNTKIKELDDVFYQDLRFDISYPITRNISFRNRAEVVKYQKGSPAAEYGFMIYQDVLYRPKSSKISGNCRLSWFHTASYDSRVYSFENDVGLPNSANKIKEMAEELFGPGTKPENIILTHGHFDHRGSLPDLLKIWDVPVYANDLELPYLTGLSAYPPADPFVGGGLMSLTSWLFPNKPLNLGDKVQAFPEEGTPGLPGWRIIPTPGHSPGHISLFRESDKVLIAGDAFVTTVQESALSVIMQKKIISGPPKYFTCDWKAAGVSVRKLIGLHPQIVATGHGKPMFGKEFKQSLQHMGRNFAEEAVPKHGRYVNESAQTDIEGVKYVPPAKNNPVITGSLIGAAALIAFAVVVGVYKK